MTQPSLPRDLGDGLVLRWATPADTEALAQFNGLIHGEGQLNGFVAGFTRDAMSAQHPAIGAHNFTLVEDTRLGRKIVSSLCLIPQTWTYAGIPFGVGRPEIVGTDPAYRRRGLVRAQMEVIHDRSAELGHRVQAITGIPWYYRQFGYEYALTLGGGRQTPLSSIPRGTDNAPEPYRLRPLTVADIPFVKPLYDRACARALVACPRSGDYWRYLLTGPTPGAYEDRAWRLIETASGEPVGYAMGSREMWGTMFAVPELEVAEGVPIRAVLPCVLRGLREIALAEAARQNKEPSVLYFNFGAEHPAFAAASDLMPVVRPSYAWYLRLRDVPAFLRLIAPELEMRLRASTFAGHTADMLLSEQTSGFRIRFDQGRLTAIEPWPSPDAGDDLRANFPPLVFLKLLFGYKALAEIQAAFPDCQMPDETRGLLEALFPRRYSWVVPVGG